jgi:hypothetical protein
MPRSVSEERMVLLARAVEDGWPLREITHTYGLDYHTIRKHYPDYVPVSRHDLGTLSVAVKAARRALAQRGIKL